MTRHAEIQAQIETMVAYLRLKLEARDWHGVSDAASDIRELEARRNEAPHLLDHPCARYGCGCPSGQACRVRDGGRR